MKYISEIGRPKNLFSYLVFGCLIGLGGLSAQADSFLFTTNADFDEGDLNGLSYDIPDQLQLSVTGTTFSIMWIANGGEDTISKMDTDTNIETARYRTWLGSGTLPQHSPFAGPAPSRTGVDIEGNVYVANRHFDGKTVSVVKILAEGGIDRNGNGTIETSTDTNASGTIQASEVLPVNDTNANGRFDCNAVSCESTDERVAWVAYVGGPGGLGRSLCVGNDGNIWVGLYNHRQYYKISAADGSPLAGPFPVTDNPYGCAVDGNGILWGANLSTVLTKLDTSAAPAVAQVGRFFAPTNFYGITLGKDGSGNTKVFGGSYSPARSFVVFNPATNTFTTPASQHITSYGVSVDGDGNVVVGNTGNGIRKFKQDGTLLCSGTPQGSGDFRGVIVDANNDIWLVQLANNNVAKYRGTDCGSLGTFPVGHQPYTYSDVTGFAARNVTNPTGLWTLPVDSGVAGFKWNLVTYTASLPTNAVIVVKVRTAETEAGLANQNFVEVAANGSFLSIGRFIEIQTRLTANTASESPILFDLTASGSPPNEPPIALCQSVTLNAPANACSVNADVDAGSFDPNGDGLLFSQSPAGPYGIGSTIVQLTVTEEAPAPGLSAVCEAEVIVLDVTPPTVDAGADVMLEATSASGAAYAISPTGADGCGAVTLSASPDLSVYPLGETVVTVTATDESGNTASDQVTITVKDTTAPTGDVEKIGNGTLWPPNHKQVKVATLSNVTDAVDAAVDVTITVTSNQPINGPGDGNTNADWNVVANANGTWDVWVRSERSGTLAGPRIYTITMTITDDAGNSTVQTCEVTVPHDQGTPAKPKK